MRDSRTSAVTWASLSWLLPLAFLALPGCELFFPLEGSGPPQDWAIFCDIEDRNVPRRCATPADLVLGVRMAGAAVALTTRQSSKIGLDYSPQAIQEHGCALDQPVAITFAGDYPKGSAKCVKDAPDAIGPNGTWHDANQVCYAKCVELFRSEEFDPTLSPFCNQNARASTSFPPLDDDDQDDLLAPYHLACAKAGMQHWSYDTETNPDPRRLAEPAPWFYVSPGILVNGTLLNSLTRTTPFTGQWDQGAATRHLITEGDGYVEFTATDTTSDRACGLSSGVSADTDPNVDSIGFGVRLAAGTLPNVGALLIYQSGPVLPFRPYATGDRIRIRFTDNFDGTANIAYHVIPAGTLAEAPLGTGGPAAYPLRVDAALLTQFATLGDVRVVRVKKSLF